MQKKWKIDPSQASEELKIPEEILDGLESCASLEDCFNYLKQNLKRSEYSVYKGGSHIAVHKMESQGFLWKAKTKHKERSLMIVEVDYLDPRERLIDRLYDAKAEVEKSLPHGLYCIEEVEPGRIAVRKEPFDGTAPAIIFVRKGATRPNIFGGGKDHIIEGGCFPVPSVMKNSDIDEDFVLRMLHFVSTPGAVVARLIEGEKH